MKQYKQLTSELRYQIYGLKQAEPNQSEIAKNGVSKSTISREFRLNKGQRGRLERLACVPIRPIKHHDDLVLRVACREFIERKSHTPGMGVRGSAWPNGRAAFADFREYFGEFFKCFLRSGSALRMPLAGYKLAPVMPKKSIVLASQYTQAWI